MELSQTTLTSPKQSDEAFVPTPPPMVHNPDALFAKDFCDMLNSLETTLYGCGRRLFES
jgi:hypothetical protein